MVDQRLAIMALAGSIGVWSSAVAAVLIPPIRWCSKFLGIPEPPGFAQVQFSVLFLGLFCYVLKGFAADPRISPTMAAGLFLAIFGLYESVKALSAQQRAE